MSLAFVRLALIGASLLFLISGSATAARRHVAEAQSLSMENVNDATWRRGNSALWSKSTSRGHAVDRTWIFAGRHGLERASIFMLMPHLGLS